MVGLGIIGCGTWGHMHGRVYTTSPGVRLVAVSDQDASRAQTMRTRPAARIATFCAVGTLARRVNTS